MASNYYTEFPERKTSATDKQSVKGAKKTLSMKEKPVGYPGIPGKGGPDRSGGTPRKGYAGPFNIKKDGFSG